MKVYWRTTRRGQRLVLSSDEGDEHEGDEHEEENEVEVGGVRETKRGFDAFAKTFSYEPGRAEKGIGSMEEAKEFVEQFRPWELFEGGHGLTVEAEVRPEA